MDFIAEAEQEIAAGKLWRAKEILHKSVKHAGYDVQLFEKLGIVLMEMSDLAEAGKYLFLSGVRKPEYEEAIAIFLKKYEGMPHNLFHPFPRSAKLPRIADYPASVAKELKELGFSDGLETVHGIQPPNNSPVGMGGMIAIAVFGFTVFSIVVLMILGVVKFIEIVFR